MGQKVHPTGFRLGVIRSWDSRWFREKGYSEWLLEDTRLRKFVRKELKSAGISRIDIERAANKCKVNIHTARPGIVIGKKGAGIEQLKKQLQSLSKSEVFLNIHEIRKAETDAQLVAENVAQQLERRVAFRRAMKKAMQTAQKFGAKGFRISCSGRLVEPRCQDASGIEKGGCLCIRCVRTSNMVLQKPKRPTALLG
jgi:small subunit ribosomal protein S3